MIEAVYIHIPFCTNICSYCDFCKIFYNSKIVDYYLDVLKDEIKEKYCGEVIKTIYIGGGTPTALSIHQLRKLLEITKIFKTENLEFSVETNVGNISEEKLNLLKKYNVNRLSIGVQTINKNSLKLLNRYHTKREVQENISLAFTKIPNISVDLMYAIPGETKKNLVSDLNFILKLGVKHISTYSLIIEKHTKLYNDKINYIDEDLDYEMYQLICKTLKKHGYNHYEVSNFAKKGYESRHNLTYWNNKQYYGFGLGASYYIHNTRYENTRSLTKYLNHNYIKEQYSLSKNETIENEFILGLRKIDGIDLDEFKKKYHINIESIYIVQDLIMDGKLVIDNNCLKITTDYIYKQNDILYKFLDIDYEKLELSN